MPTISPRLTRLRRPLVALAVGLCWTSAVPAVAQPAPDDAWPMAGRDAGHSGAADGPAPPYRTAWTARFEGRGPLEGPVVSGDVVLLLGVDSVLALDADSGEVRWEAERREGPVGPPAVARDLLIHASGRDAGTALVARRIDDGREEWREFTGGSIPGGVTVEGDVVFAATHAGEVLAIDAVTGEREWRFQAAGNVRTTSAVVDGRVIVSAQSAGTGVSTLHAVGVSSGEEEWRFSPTGPPRAFGTSPAGGAGLAFAGLSDGQIHALDLGTGIERWSERPLPDLVSAGPFGAIGIPAASDGSTGDGEAGLYVPGFARIARLESATGEERWSYQLPDLLGSSPSLSGPYALIGDVSGLAASIDVRSGLLVWKRDLGPGPLGSFAVTRDGVFVSAGRDDGVVVALEHDPAGDLLGEESPTVVDPVRAGLGFLGAAVALGALLLLLFRSPEILRRRSGKAA